MDILRKGKEADIGLLLEGTYPYVRGGVSSWVNQIIRGFPDLTFALCFLGSQRGDYKELQYELPDNVVHLEAHYLHDRNTAIQIASWPGDPQVFQVIRALHDGYREKRPDEHCLHLEQIIQYAREGKYGEKEFLYSRESWNYIMETYRNCSTEPSLIDYFWTVRTMHGPVWKLIRIAEEFVPCRVYHTVCTGYAGFLGALLKRSRQRPLIVSEHGLYTKERKIDLFQADWISDTRSDLERGSSDAAYLRELWIRFFEALGLESYQAADTIIALYEASRQRQLQDGAPAARTLLIPNGVDLPRFERLKELRAAGIPPVVCLIGRVVPIKDVKTFIWAMRIVSDALPGVQAWIAGPEDEDRPYAAECRQLAQGLGDAVRFLGFQKVEDILPRTGVLVLSSISEALPLVVLEACAAGVPCVTTDVGACRQLIEGWSAEDQALGEAGSVVDIADPEALAAAIIRLLGDPGIWLSAQQAGGARVRRYYGQEMMLDSYRQVYERALEKDDREAAAGTPRGCPWPA